jgi:endonuclease G
MQAGKEEKRMSTFEELLQETEERFSQRAPAREEFDRRIGAGRILDADTPERVRKRLDRLQIDREAAEALLERGVTFAPITAPGEPLAGDQVVLERILGTNDLIGVNFLELGLLVSRAVGRVHIRNSNGQTEGYGTGFMVSPRLLLTNNHVLTSRQAASFSQVEFNYQIGVDGQPLPSVFFPLSSADFFLTDQHLDYTLVAVAPRSADGRELQEFGWVRLIEEEGKIIKGESMNVLQHPGGEPKQLALRANQLVDILDDFLHYQSDTAPGSSGAWVGNDQWEVVALHHSGVPRRDPHGNILTRDGQQWHPSMGEHRIDWVANEGVRVSRIVRHIQGASLSPGERQLRAELFELTPPSLSLQGASVEAPVERDYGLAASGPIVRDDAGVTWTVPLSVTVHVGQAPAVRQVPQTPSIEAPATVLIAAPKPDPELREALSELEAACSRDYYDEEGDAAAREEYYGGLDDTLKPGKMFERLSTLVRTTHTKWLKYNPSKHVYPWVDLHRDLKLRSIYSGHLADPEEFIQEDFRISYERARRIQEILAVESAVSAGQLEAEIDQLESYLPYNCEHVVPQSWFEKREPMRGDLHHLFACEWGCNSFRGNKAYYDFADFEEALRDACGKRVEPNQFEPASGKGAVSRAMLYFLLRYPGEVGVLVQEFDRDRLPILLDWHESDPVEDYEKHRNMAIYEKQGNRNPLIDFPEWATKIDFALGFGE